MLAERIAASQLAEMSAAGAALSFSFRPAELPRLLPLLAGAPGDGGSLQARAGFRVGLEGVPVIRLEIRGELPLICQRCLGPVTWPLDIDVTLALVGSDAQAESLASPFDSVVLDADGDLLLRSMVEDEVLATLPLAPMHVAAADCARSDAPAVSPGLTAGIRPFEGLAGMMGNDGKK